MRVLTQRELNRALLARQLLLRRARLPVARAVERVGALQAQWPPSPYIALWSRLEGFRREQLLRAVERRQVVKATLMRMTLHHVSARDYLAYAGLIVSRRAASLERRAQRSDVDELVAAAVAYATEEPRSRPELLSFLSLPRTPAQDPRAWLIWHLLTARGGARPHARGEHLATTHRQEQVRPCAVVARRAEHGGRRRGARISFGDT